MNHLTIKNWAEEDRPREKLITKGCSTLTESELLAIILGSGTRTESAIDLAKKILKIANNNLDNLGKFSFDDFIKIKGIGNAKAVSLLATFEIGRRRNLSEVKAQNSIRSSNDIFNVMHPKIGDIKHEEFWAIYLNNRNVIINEKRISSGGVTKTVVDAKIIARHAISSLATGIILCHNHPSGNIKPSEADKQLTLQIAEASKLIDCRILDHVIIAGKNYYSFCDEGLL